MSKSLTIPTLPEAFASSDDGYIAIVRPVVNSLVEDLSRLSGIYVRAAEADAAAESALKESNEPEAVEYRSALTQYETAVAALEEQEKASIAAIREQFKARKSAGSDAVNELRTKALATQKSELLSDVDMHATATDYAAKYGALVNLGKSLVAAVPAMAEWIKSVPSETVASKVASGKSVKGARKANGEDARWTPRHAFIRVSKNGEDFQDITPATFGALAKHVGIKAAEGGRDFLGQRLLSAVGTPDGYSFTEPTEFSFTKDNANYVVSLMQKTPRSAENNDAEDHAENSTADTETVPEDAQETVTEQIGRAHV